MFEDFRDGCNLLLLLEILTDEKLVSPYYNYITDILGNLPPVVCIGFTYNKGKHVKKILHL